MLYSPPISSTVERLNVDPSFIAQKRLICSDEFRMSIKTAEKRKLNLMQIVEEKECDEPMAMLEVVVRANDDENLEPVEPARELSFFELWGKNQWRQFTSITPGECVSVDAFGCSFRVEIPFKMPLLFS